MKKSIKTISNPDDLNKHLQYTSPVTWIVLFVVTAILVAFFTWASIYKLKEKISGVAEIKSHEVTLHIEESQKKRLEVGQKVYILDLVGEITSFVDEEPMVTPFELDDGEYTYTIVLKEYRPIDFLLSK